MKEFKVGNKVFDLRYGIGEVSEICNNVYPISCHFRGSNTFENSYTVEGRSIVDHKYPSLFHFDDAKQRFPEYFQKKYRYVTSEELMEMLLNEEVYKISVNGNTLCISVLDLHADFIISIADLGKPRARWITHSKEFSIFLREIV